MPIIKYKNFVFTYSDNKFNLNEILYILGYRLKDNNIWVEKHDLIQYLNLNTLNDKEFLDFLNNDFIEPIVNIYKFIEKKNFVMIDNNLFNELWFSIENDKDILITKTIINFIFSQIKKKEVDLSPLKLFYQRKKKFLSLLFKHNIPFETVNYENEKCKDYKYILDEIKNTDEKNLHLKRYILMTKTNFKTFISIKNTILNEFYLNIEKLHELYHKYIENINNKNFAYEYEYEYEYELEQINLRSQLIKQFNKTEEKSTLNIKKRKTQNRKILKYIYISSTKYYERLNKFKLGISLFLDKKPKNYETDSNLFFYCFYDKVYNAEKIKNVIYDTCKDFMDDENDLFIIDYIHFKNLLKIAIKNNNEVYSYINYIVLNKLKCIYYFLFTEPDEIIDDHDSRITCEIKLQLGNIIEKHLSKKIYVILRKKIVSDIKVYNINKLTIWNYVKELLNWKCSKTSILYKNKEIYIIF